MATINTINPNSNRNGTTQMATNRWHSTISKLKAALTPKKKTKGPQTEIDFYHQYVYSTRFEEKVEAAINHLPQKE